MPAEGTKVYMVPWLSQSDEGSGQRDSLIGGEARENLEGDQNPTATWSSGKAEEEEEEIGGEVGWNYDYDDNDDDDDDDDDKAKKRKKKKKMMMMKKKQH